eukprot:CAMPEP_0174321128 /NCGR_PEP_ID=MMETSP0810-20121108/10047_1 /TAXON_ID=73025 ORGANISM="Eutreptiella gymnastica-like, Strain CCMP1594" /NCGR_SAMPLE_ID=MMETSP0810 /ASSEMBLY_ACC=CAM_ASM_000659 /LENGTH=51 /DNA_ID=CAMNT_0015432345 /DNA_START=130 /DNA_END=281 /DNA_ORIENTATION=-
MMHTAPFNHCTASFDLAGAPKVLPHGVEIGGRGEGGNVEMEKGREGGREGG